jgi:hypothetical protein
MSVATLPTAGYNNLFIGTAYLDSLDSNATAFTAGIYRSQDGGDTWKAVNNGLIPYPNILRIGSIRSIAINKSQPDDVLAATSFGLFRTYKATGPCLWQIVSGIPPSITFFTKVLYHPTSNNIIYAAGDDIIKSTSGGSQWSTMTGAGTGLDFLQFPAGTQVQGITLGVTQDAPDYLYASIVTETNGAFRYYFYIYNGSQWTLGGGGIYSYYGGFTADRLCIAVSPANYREIDIGQDNLFKSMNGGAVFSCIGGYCGSIHPDMHDLAFSPVTNVLYAATDGGIYKRPNESSNLWTQISNGLSVGLVNKLGSSPTNPDLIAIGKFDEGSFLLDNSKTAGQKWKQVGNNDGFEQIIAPNNLDMYACGAPGGCKGWAGAGTGPHINHNTNGWSTTVNNELGEAAAAWNCPWDLPYVLDPSGDHIYFGNNEIYEKLDPNTYECKNSGQDVTWKPMSSFQAEYLSAGKRVKAIEFAPSNKNYIYAATHPNPPSPSPYNDANFPPSPSRLYRTKQGGGATNQCLSPSTGTLTQTNPLVGNQLSPAGSCWEELLPSSVTSVTYFTISSIAVHPEKAEKIWIAYSGYDANDKVKAYNGSTWADYSTGLPNSPVNCIVYEKGSNDGLYVATDLGVYYRDAAMPSWQPFMNGLPNVIVNEIEINYVANKIRAATLGRGLWESDLACPTLGSLTMSANIAGLYEAQTDLNVLASAGNITNTSNVTLRAGDAIDITATGSNNVILNPTTQLFIHPCDHPGNSFRKSSSAPPLPSKSGQVPSKAERRQKKQKNKLPQ